MNQFPVHKLTPEQVEEYVNNPPLASMPCGLRVPPLPEGMVVKKEYRWMGGRVNKWFGHYYKHWLSIISIKQAGISKKGIKLFGYSVCLRLWGRDIF